MDYLAALAGDVLLVMTLGLPRIISAISVLAFLGPQLMGGPMARTSITVGLTLVIYPLLAEEITAARPEGLAIFGIAVKEMFIGLAIGYTVTVVFWSIQAVGFFIDNQRGAAMASSMDPLLGAQSSPLGLLMSQTLVALFFTSGLFLVFLDGIYTSYRMWPVMSFFPSINAELLAFFLKQFALIAKLAVVVGGPIIITMFLAEFGLGLIGRFAPQLNVFFLAMPIKSAIANFMLILFWGALILYFGNLLEPVQDNLHELDRIFR